MEFSGRKLHLIGIGGAGMSGLALVAHGLGAAVSGSDRSESSYTERLAATGVRVSIGHDAANVPSDADVIVSTAIGEENPELAHARAAGLRVLHRSDLLAELVAAKPRCVAVAGTHGKTTTTAMIAHVLAAVGVAPSFFVGGEVRVDGELTNAGWGDGDVVVVEADESDRSFLKLSPEVAVVTNVELDHHGTWRGGLDELLSAFARFAEPAARLVLWSGQPKLAALDPHGRACWFGVANGALPAGGFVARDVVTPADPARGSTFTLCREDERIDFELGVRGEHNVLNALAALAALDAVGVSPDRAADVLTGFTGVARRFERIGTSSCGARIYDDYAHHPTEVRAALATARATAEGGRVIAVFQPHLYSRTASLAGEFGRELAAADVAIVLDVYAAREQAADFPGVSGWNVATAVADARPGMRVLWTPTASQASAALTRELRAGDLCLTIGAGDVFKIGHELAGRA